MKSLFLSTALVLGLCAPALAQVNFVPQIGVSSATLRAPTYSAAIKNLVPEPTAATDFFCITASASKKIHVNRIELSGTGTAASQVVFLLHNTVKDTGTTAVVGTFGPVPNPLSTVNAAATATTVAYNTTSGNPTGGVSNVATLIRSGVLGVVASTLGTPTTPLVWDFGSKDEFYNQRLVLQSGGTDQYCLNFAGATVTASVLQGYIEWTEE